MKYEMHIAGPDDVHEFDDELKALRAANEINKQSLDFNADKWDDGSFVLMVATVREKADSKRPEIPQKYEGHGDFDYGPDNLTNRMRRLQVGDYIELPLKQRGWVHFRAKKLEIKIATRQMGSEDTFRMYRVE